MMFHKYKLCRASSYAAGPNMIKFHMEYVSLRQKGILKYDMLAVNKENSQVNTKPIKKGANADSIEKPPVNEDNCKDNTKPSKKGLKSDLTKKPPGLAPVHPNEICSVCILCFEVVTSEDHYHTKHEDTAANIQELIQIGRALAGRLVCIGPKEVFGKAGNTDTLRERLSLMYGPNDSKDLRHPKKSVQNANQSVKRCNEYMKSKKSNRAFNRKFSASMNDFELGRSDLGKDMNLFCILCGVWIKDRWTVHELRKHQHLSPLQKDVIRSYSIRLKMVMLHYILLSPELLKEYGFFTFLKKSHYVLDDEPLDVERDAYFGKIKTVLRFVKLKLIRRKADLLYYNYKSNVIGEPLFNDAIVAGYRKIKSLFGASYKGFCDMRFYENGFKFSEVEVAGLRRANPPHQDSLNFACYPVESEEDEVYHTVFLHFQAIPRTVRIFDGSSTQRRKRPNQYLEKIILALHPNTDGNLRYGYPEGYCYQVDTWSCGLRAIFCCVAVIADKNPVAFHPNLRGLFNLLKSAVEKNGQKLEGQTLEDIWTRISRPVQKYKNLANAIRFKKF